MSFLRKLLCITPRNQPVQTGAKGQRPEECRMEVSGKTMDRMLVNLWKILLRGIVWSCRGNLGQRVRENKTNEEE